MSALPKLKVFSPPTEPAPKKRDRYIYRPSLSPFLLAIAQASNGLTDIELEGMLGMLAHQRRRDLARLGLVEDSGHLRLGRGRVRCKVWVATKEGRKLAITLNKRKGTK